MPRKSARAAKRVWADDLTHSLRLRIVEGPWGPGDRLPTKLELCDIFAAAPGTVQKALNHLSDEGFIRSRGRLGTFVRDRPPNMARFGVLFPEQRGHSIWYDTLADSAVRIAEKERRWLDCFFGCRYLEGHASEAIARVEDDVLDGRLAALVIACSAAELAGSPILRYPGLTRAWLAGTHPPSSHDKVIAFQPPHMKAMRHFQARARKRLSVMTTFSFDNEKLQHILAAAKQCDLETHRRWTHHVDPAHHRTAKTIAELLMSLPPDQRPDALYINDDHLVASVTAGIADAGIKVPEELDLVAHANFPNVPGHDVPVAYLGYDMEDVIKKAVSLIDDSLAGKRTPSNRITIFPLFDFEAHRCRDH